jgi:hypothetical protein
MPEAATLPRVLIAATNADWNEEPFRFFAGGPGQPEDFTGAPAKFGLRLAGQPANATEFTTDNGMLTLTLPNEIAITAPVAVISALAPGLYDWDLIVTYPAGDTQTLLLGHARIAEGLA